jgi:hypothetical protein
MCATCPIPPTLLDLITLIIFSEEYKLRSSLLCSFLYPPVTFSLLMSVSRLLCGIIVLQHINMKNIRWKTLLDELPVCGQVVCSPVALYLFSTSRQKVVTRGYGSKLTDF